MDIGSNIQFHRKQLGLSQEELGQHLCVSRQTISQWETGQTVPTLDNLLRLKDILRISLDALCSEDSIAIPQAIPIKEYRFTPDAENTKEISRFAGRPNLHRFIISLAISVLLILIIMFNGEDPLYGMWIFFLVLIVVPLTIRFLKNRKMIRKPWKATIGNYYIYQLFADYFQELCFRNGELVVSSKHYYRDIQKFHSTKQFVILQVENVFHALPCHALSEDTPLTEHLQTNPLKKAPGPNKVVWKTVSLIIFIASLATIFGALFFLGFIMERNKLFAQNMWVFFLFLPIPIASIIFGILAKRKGYPQRKNIVIGIIMTAVLSFYGCFTFIFSGFINDDSIGVEQIEYYFETDIPEYTHISTMFYDVGDEPTDPDYIWYTSEVFFGADNSNELERWIGEDGHFLNTMPSELSGLTRTVATTQGCDYMLIYNVDTKQYNQYPEESGIYRMLFIGFSRTDMCLYISEYNINYIAN